MRMELQEMKVEFSAKLNTLLQASCHLHEHDESQSPWTPLTAGKDYIWIPSSEHGSWSAEKEPVWLPLPACGQLCDNVVSAHNQSMRKTNAANDVEKLFDHGKSLSMTL